MENLENIRNLYNGLTENRWKMSSKDENFRIQKLMRLKEEVISRREEITQALFNDFKKPLAEGELTEIHPVIDEINFALKNIKKWMKPVKVKTPLPLIGTCSKKVYEAKGVVCIIAPWNYPFALMINPIVAAIAAGNCVLAKPSEKTPHTALIIESILKSVFEENEVAVVCGDVAVATYILDLQFDHIFFTGSTNVGKIIMAKAAKFLTPLTLELGGKSPVVLDSDSDLEESIRKIVWGKFLNGGQTCVAPDYFFVPELLKDKVYKMVIEQINIFYGNTPNERIQSKDFARIIDRNNFDRLYSQIEFANKINDDIPNREECFIAPTVLVDVKSTDAIMQDEIFGPILPIMTYEKLDDVIEFIRKRDKPLALYIFSKDNTFIKRLLSETTAGGVAINNTIIHLANPYLPFGGVGHSGMGSYHGEYGFKTFSHEKSILYQGKFSLIRMYFPPYNGNLSKIAFKLMKLFFE